MIKAILLDLDDTLLGNPTDTFVRQYLGLLSAHLRERLGVTVDVIEALHAGVRDVARSSDPRTTNEAVFYARFEPMMGLDRAQMDGAIDEFYREVYPRLRPVTQRRLGARRLVDWLLAHDYRVAVATNPYFPTTAIEQRLDWAGTPVDQVPFALVTTLNNMHYAKPHPAYYEEILARIGVQADEAIMVGDDWDNDILPAARAGLNTFWLCDDGGEACPDDDFCPDGCGTLADFASRVQDENWLETLEPRPLVPEQIEPRFKGNLAALLGIVSEAPKNVWHMRPEEQEWSPIEVLCHLTESESEVQRKRLELIANEDDPFLSQPKAPPAPASRICPEDAWKVALAFAQARDHTLEYLGTLTADQWQRPARHYIFGPTTLLEMANFTAQHDRLHLTQLCQTIGKCV